MLIQHLSFGCVTRKQSVPLTTWLTSVFLCLPYHSLSKKTLCKG